MAIDPSDCPTRDLLVDYAANRLSLEDSAKIAAHLLMCSRCEQAYLQAGNDSSTPSSILPLDPTRSSGSASTTSLDSPADHDESDPVPGYHLLSVIGSGAQGTVHKATQLSTGRVVALKLLKYSRDPSYQAGKFENELALIASLDHPNIVTVYDGSAKEGRCFLAMKYIHGRPLTDYLATRRPSVEDTVRLMVKICRAIEYAHHKGIVHRDLKPANILVDHDGQPHILDFGIAKSTGLNVSRRLDPTSTGQFIGTLTYAAPEQLRAEPSQIDHRTDVYTLGVILYEALTGRQPYELKGTLEDFLDNIAHHSPTPPSILRPELSLILDIIIGQAMSKEKNRRYQSAGELADDLERYLKDEPILAKRDSLGYIVRSRVRRQARRHPIVALAAAAALALLLAICILEPLEYRWTPLHSVFSRTVTRWFAPIPPGGRLEHVCVVGITDDTNFEKLADQEGLEGISSANRPSLRRLHGRLMHILAAAKPRVVVFDLILIGPAIFDTDFSAGVEFLKSEGIDVVVPSPNWWLREGEIPQLSEGIKVDGRYGAITAVTKNTEPWKVDIAVRRGTGRTLPSLALRALASYRRPATEQVDFVLVPGDREIELQYYRRDPGTGVPTMLGKDRVQVDITSFSNDNPNVGLAKGDLCGGYTITVPPNDVLDASTLDYDWLFTAEPEELRSKLENRVVIVANLRSDSGDRHQHPDGRELPGGYAIAIAIEYLVSVVDRGRHVPGPVPRFSDSALFAILGVSLGVVGAHRRVLRYICIGLFVMLCVLSSLILAATQQVLWSPFVPLATLVLASEVAAPLWRSYHTQRTG